MTDRWITQDKFFDKEKGTRGNCQQAATASLLGLSVEEVPNFMECPQGFWKGFWDFVTSRGYAIIELSGPRHFDCLHLAYGPSPRGVDHAVIYQKGKLVWDPHPSRGGILEVTTVCILVPADLAQFTRTSHETIEPRAEAAAA